MAAAQCTAQVRPSSGPVQGTTSYGDVHFLAVWWAFFLRSRTQMGGVPGASALTMRDMTFSSGQPG